MIAFVQKKNLPSSIWLLSTAAFFLNFSSVLVFGGTPILFMKYFQTNETKIGVLEGTVEAFALIIRSFVGVLSDFTGKRKQFIWAGYLISVVSRFLLAPATFVEAAIFSRFMEKFGNGMQASPREAFISDFAPKSLLGRAYGLNKTFSMAGSYAGSFLMLILYLYRPDFDIRVLLWFAAVISAVAFCVVHFLKEPPLHEKESSAHAYPKFSKSFVGKVQEIWRDLNSFSMDFWKVLGIICLFKFGYFSGNFVMKLLRDSPAELFGHVLSKEHMLSNALFLVIQNLSCTLFAYPIGLLSDTLNRKKAVYIGFGFMLCSLIIFAIGYKIPGLLYGGIICYGLQMSMQGALLALLTCTMPAHLHGTGFGIFFFSSGISILFTNHFFMGIILKHYGNTVCFLGIAVFILLAWILLWKLKPFSVTYDARKRS